MYIVYIKSNYKQFFFLNLVLFQDYLYKNDRTFHNLPVQVLGSIQHVVIKDKVACFLDTQPIPDLVVYETECTEPYPLNWCWRCWWCCQFLYQVSKDCSILSPGVWGDADRFCREVAAREGSSLGLEVDEACDEARVTASKPCAHILLLLHCQLLPSVLEVEHVRCSSVMAFGIACWQLSLGGGVQVPTGGPARHRMHLPVMIHRSDTCPEQKQWVEVGRQGLCHSCRGSNPSPWQLSNCRMRSPSLALGWSAGSSICWQGNFWPCLSHCSIWYPQPGQAWGLWWFLKYFCTTVMYLVMADGVQSLPSSCSQTALCLFLTLLAGVIIEKGITKTILPLYLGIGHAFNGYIRLRPFYALNCLKPVSYISSTYVSNGKGIIYTCVIL